MAAISSVGTIFGGTGASEIKGIVTSVSLGGITTAEIDTTALADNDKTYVMGTLDAGTVEVGVNLNSQAGSTGVTLPTAGDNTISSWTLTFGTPSATNSCPRYTMTGYIQSVSVEAGVDQQLTATYTLRLTDAITVAQATS